MVGWFGFNLKACAPGFYVPFVLTVTASVQVVGGHPVFASLIVPALGRGGHGAPTRLASPATDWDCWRRRC